MTPPAQKRPLTPLYIFFYIIFWPDTWRIVIGLAAAGLITPRLIGPDSSWFQTGMLFIMLAAIAYAASAKPARRLSSKLRQIIVKKN